MIEQSQTENFPFLVLTAREIRRDRAFAPGGDRFEELVKQYLPLVYGTASLLLGENQTAKERVTIAVFKSSAFRWKRLSRKTIIGTWLLRSTWLAAQRERKQSGPGTPEADSAIGINHFFLKKLLRLRINVLNSLVLSCVLKQA